MGSGEGQMTFWIFVRGAAFGLEDKSMNKKSWMRWLDSLSGNPKSNIENSLG
jgi:hypothetical protein